MAELLKYRWHLLIIAVLLLAKTLWVPLWQEKQQNWQQYQSISDNLEKTNSLLAVEADMQNRFQASTDLLAQQEQQLLTAPADVSTKLKIQQQLEQLFKEAKVDISQSSWREGIPLDGVTELFFDVRAESGFGEYIQLLNLLDLKPVTGVSLTEQSVNIRNQSQQSLGNTQNRMVFRVVLLAPEEGV